MFGSSTTIRVTPSPSGKARQVCGPVPFEANQVKKPKKGLQNK